MKLSVQQNSSVVETEVSILCKRIDGEVSEIISFLDGMGKRIGVERDGRYFLIEVEDVYYIEAVDRNSFLYTDKDVLKSRYLLHELEDTLRGKHYVRANKKCIINLNHVRSLEPTFGGKMEAVMRNGDRIVVSRHYSALLKQKVYMR